MDEIIKSLRLSSRRLVREFDMIKGNFRSTGYTHSECHTLIELEQYGVLTLKELADLLNVDKSIISRTVNKLTKNGLVKQVKRNRDNREKPITLTAKGFKEVGRLNKEANSQVADALELLKEEERLTVLEGIQSYSRALNKIRRQSGYNIRRIQRGDNKFIERIIIDVMTEFGAVGEGYSIKDEEVSNMYDAYDNDRSVYYVIEREGEIVGGSGIGPLEKGDKDVCELKKMYFIPDLRGIGLGEKLLRLCLESAKEMGYKKCYLETLGRMPQARGLYEKFGFKPLKSPLGCTGHFNCEAWYIKEL